MLQKAQQWYYTHSNSALLIPPTVLRSETHAVERNEVFGLKILETFMNISCLF